MRNACDSSRLIRTALAALFVLCTPVALYAADAVSAAFDLQAAVRKASAGDVIRVPVGVYPAPLIIDNSLTLISDGDAVIDAGGRGDILRVNAADVTIRGLRLRGSGDSLDLENAGLIVSAPRAVIENNTLEDVLLGIVLRGAHDSRVSGNVVYGKPLDAGRRGDGIRLWNSNNCRLEGNRVCSSRDVVIWYSRGTHIIGNEVSQCRYGLHFMYASGSVLEENRLIDNSVGVFLMYSADILLRDNLISHNRGPSGYGLGLKDMDAVTIEDNAFIANRVGIYFDNSPQRVDSFGEVTRNLIAYNDIGLAFQPSVRRNRFHENAFVENIEQVAILGSGEFKDNSFTVAGRGNYWSDYTGFDADGDGIGEMEHRSISLFENLMDREPKMRLFLYSPAQQAIELAARAFPVMRPAPKITDAAPLMRAMVLCAAEPAQANTESLSRIGGGLAGVAALVWAGRRRAMRTREVSPATEAPFTAPPPTSAPLAASRIAPFDLMSGGAPGNDADCIAEVNSSIVSIRGLRKAFGRVAVVDRFDLDVRPGQAVALWGANGAGKTTIVKCLLGLHAWQGSVRIGDFDARRAGKSARRLIGYVSQELAYHDDLTAKEAARLFARLRRCPLMRVDAVLDRVGLREHAGKRVAALSGGMKQRLALAIALLSDPPVLLLDEPTSNLDAAARRDFIELLISLKNCGKTVIFTTHRPEEVARLADQLVVLRRGRAVYVGSPAGLQRSELAATRVRLILPAEKRCTASAVLRRGGFTVQPNHNALIVAVSPLQKAAPVIALAEAGIRIDDFELEGEVDDAQ